MGKRKQKTGQRGAAQGSAVAVRHEARETTAASREVGVQRRVPRQLATLRRWEEGILFGLLVAIVLGAFTVWAVLMLSADAHLYVKWLASTFVGALSAGLYKLLRRRMEHTL